MNKNNNKMKVLSIDLDYIMPSIENCFYEFNRYFHPNPAISWDLIFEHSNIQIDDIPIDVNNLMFCYQLFLKCLKESKSVSFGYDHDAILYAIDKFENIELIHIDHHDDFLHGEFLDIAEEYQKQTGDLRAIEYEQIIRNNHVNEGNWIAWLHVNKKLSSYTWVSNENSRNKDRNDIISFLFPDYLCIEKEQLELSSYNFDHIFVCLSPQYLPPQYWNYFSMFMIAYEEITGKSSLESLVANKKYELETRYSKLNQNIKEQICYNKKEK
jgi:hypothetical protein